MPQVNGPGEGHDSVAAEVDRAFAAIHAVFAGDAYRDALTRSEVVHFPGLVKGMIAGFPGLPDIELAIEQTALRPKYLRVYSGRESLDLERVKIVHHNRIDPQMLANAALMGNTFVFNRLQRFIHKAHLMTRRFEEWVGDPVEIGAIASFASSSGLDLHNDFENLIIVQIEGTKEWTLYGDPVAPGSIPPPDEQLGEPQKIRLEVGDVLFLPAGQLHFCHPDGYSVHNVIALRGANGMFLLEGLKQALDGCVALKTPAPAILGPENDKLVAEHYRAHLHELIDNLEIEKMLGQVRKSRMVREKVKLQPRKA